MNRTLRPWLVVLVLVLAYVGLTLARYQGDPLAFALPGTRYSQSDPQGTWGYDGQFAYYIARDPAGGWRYCDVPAYRYQRILYPLLARALAWGRPEAVAWTLIALNVVALAGGTYFTERLLATWGVSRWYALAYGLYGGLVAGLRLDLSEPLAYGLVQAGLWVWVQGAGDRETGRQGDKEQGARGKKRTGICLTPFAICHLPFAIPQHLHTQLHPTGNPPQVGDKACVTGCKYRLQRGFIGEHSTKDHRQDSAGAHQGLHDGLVPP